MFKRRDERLINSGIKDIVNSSLDIKCYRHDFFFLLLLYFILIFFVDLMLLLILWEFRKVMIILLISYSILVSLALLPVIVYLAFKIKKILFSLNQYIFCEATLKDFNVKGFFVASFEVLIEIEGRSIKKELAFVFMTIALSQLRFEIGTVTISFSSLLVCMMLGTVFCNLCPRSGDIMKRVDKCTTSRTVH